MKPEVINTLYIDHKFIVRNLDTYIIRNSILHALKKRKNKFGGILLDVGSGEKPYKSLLTSNPRRIIKYISLDLENNPLHDYHPDITWKDGKIPLNDESVDCAIATELFEHCPEPQKVMKEISRVLKPKGIIFFTVPFLWPLHEIPYDYYRYTPYSLKRHLEANGFMNVELEAMGGWDASLAQMLGLWVRRRRIGKIKKRILSIMFMPIIYLLYQKDKQTIFKNNRPTMITGIAGTARKKYKS